MSSRLSLCLGLSLVIACGDGGAAGGGGGDGGAGGSGGEGPSVSKHALVIGIDGVRSDALEAASTPSIDALLSTSASSMDAFAGGILGTPTEQRTLSGPGWSSILTGVWVDKHGVEFNDFVGSRFDEFPHFFQRIREQVPGAFLSSFVTWTPIHDEILAPGDADVAFSPQGEESPAADELVTDAVVAHLESENPDVVFVHLDTPDYQGHRHGFSAAVAEYIDAIETFDAQVGRMVDALDRRPSASGEDWMIVIVTDHGGLGQLHGGQSLEERTIPLIFSSTAQSPVTMSPGPGHATVPAQVLGFLEIPIDESWGWELEGFDL